MKKPCFSLKGNFVVLEKKIKTPNFDIYNINEVLLIHNWLHKLFSEEKKVPEHCLKLERWQGPPNINKLKQYETLLSFKFSLLIQFVKSWKQRLFICLVCLGIKKHQSDQSFFPKTT